VPITGGQRIAGRDGATALPVPTASDHVTFARAQKPGATGTKPGATGTKPGGFRRRQGGRLPWEGPGGSLERRAQKCHPRGSPATCGRHRFPRALAIPERLGSRCHELRINSVPSSTRSAPPAPAPPHSELDSPLISDCRRWGGGYRSCHPLPSQSGPRLLPTLTAHRRENHRIPAWWGLAGPSVGHPAQPPAEAGSPRAGCRGPCPGGS